MTTSFILLNGALESPPIPEGLYSAIISAHSGLRYLLLLTLIAAVVTAWNNMKGSKPYQGIARTMGLVTMILTDIQLLIGLVLYYVNLDARTNFKMGQLKDALAESSTRYFILEHFVMMILAVLFVHIGYATAKKKGSNKAQFRWYLVALILILAAIPWPFYGAIGRGWF